MIWCDSEYIIYIHIHASCVLEFEMQQSGGMIEDLKFDIEDLEMVFVIRNARFEY